MKTSLSALSSLVVLLATSKQVLSVAVWGQCGGIGFTGSTVCDAGSTCVFSNAYYSQCLPGAAPAPTTTPTPTISNGGGGSTTTASAPSSSICPGTRTKFKFFGVSESGAEFGNTAWPGALGTDYTWPSPSSIDFFVGQGFNTFRIPFLMERMNPPATGLRGAFNQTYLSGLQTTVSYITNKGGFAVIDPHNYMSYDNAIITSNSDNPNVIFGKYLPSLSSDSSNVIIVSLDVMNEPNGIAASVVASLNQAAINGIRAAGATSQLILLEGPLYFLFCAWQSSGNAAAFVGLTDPNNNFAIQMHQYLDSDGSGTSATCVNSTIGASRLQGATQWLQANNLKGFLGEIGAGSNSVCITAVQGALCSMQQSGAWIGALWWAAGPWWGTYYQSIEPPSGPAIAQILPQALEPFL
ncbi:endoglucanase [Flammula alnicola]|nr:endoglucanase [Flammula alnicola]